MFSKHRDLETLRDKLAIDSFVLIIVVLTLTTNEISEIKEVFMFMYSLI